MSYKTVTGKGGISATIIADSVSAVTGTRITTLELVYHRFIHGELMTHRMFSRNAMSSRAIPVERMIELVETTPAVPIHWGAKQSGMQAEKEVDNWQDFGQGQYQWYGAMTEAVKRAKVLNEQGYAKQLVNRLLEPYQLMKTLVTFTESGNFFHLRLHSDAQPEIQELARAMKEAMEGNTPELLYMQEWHTPYVDHLRDEYGDLEYSVDGVVITEQEALKVSASCSAQISYRRNDQSLEKAVAIYQKLVDSEPVHASAFEHCATPIGHGVLDIDGVVPNLNVYYQPDSWQDGVTHCDKQGNLWSGNFKGFVQYRQLIPNNVYNTPKDNLSTT